MRIRPATADDAAVGAELIHMTMGRLGDFMFGSDDARQAKQVLARLFRRRRNRFSHESSWIAVTGDRVMGLLVAYPGRRIAGLAFPMGAQLLGMLGVRGMLRFLSRSWTLSAITEAEGDEYFVNTLAVVPGARRQGIGSRLLAQAESEARRLGLAKCSLTVTIGNEPACAFYRRAGYEVKGTIETRGLERRIGFKGMLRMVRRLT